MSFFRRASVSTKLVELGADTSISALDSISPLNATATYTINGGLGTYTKSKTGNINTSTTERWGFRGNYSNYYVRATLVSGTTPSGPTLGTWWKTDTNRAWSHSLSAPDNFVDCVLKIELSKSATGATILDSHQVTISATTGAG